MKIIKRIFLIVFLLIGLGFISAASVIFYFYQDIPRITSVDDYHPMIPSKVYARGGELLTVFSKEKRDIVEISKVPQSVLDSFLAAEDSDFYSHSGIDPFGIARAFMVNLKAGRVVQGGSTITQQVAKSFLDNKERSIVRKIKDIILAYELEKHLTKEEILFLYLNQVYLGGGYYGIKQAFQGYFGKSLEEVTVAESAMVAGLLVAPSKYSPYVNPKFAYTRQKYVLKRLFENGKISESEYQEALQEKIKYRIKRQDKKVGFHFVESLRQKIVERLGNNALLTGGLEVVTTLDYDLQVVAEKVIDGGIVSIDKRQGFDKSKIEKVANENLLSFLNSQRKKILESSSTYFEIDPENFQKQTELNFLAEDLVFDEGKIVLNDVDQFEVISDYIKRQDFLKALVVFVDDESKQVLVNIAGLYGVIEEKGYSWAKERLIDSKPQFRIEPNKPSSVLSEGDLIYVKLSKVNNKSLMTKFDEVLTQKELLSFDLFQVPEVQAASVLIDSKTNEVLSLVGGGTFINSHYNRAMQASRQPGSAFKPFIYAAAIKAGFLPNSILMDSPESLDSGDHELNWKPRNYDGKYLGPITLRTSLEKSRNVTTIKLARNMGAENLYQFLEGLGFNLEGRRDLSIVLGSLGTTLLDLVERFNKLLLTPKNETPKMILSIKGIEYSEEELNEKFIDLLLPKEKEVEELEITETEEDVEEVQKGLNDKESYVVRNLLKGVVKHGTGRKASPLGNQLGGKTGTTSDYIDAWFLGFSSRLTLGVWTGFDDNKTMGFPESGSKAALPIWIGIMKKALKLYPDQEVEMPEGIVNVLIEKETGKLAGLDTKRPFLEAFIEGTEPGASELGPLSEENPKKSRKSEDEDFFNL